MYTQNELGQKLESYKGSIAIEEKGKSVSYMELLSRSNKVTAFLLSVGLNPQSRIGICSDNITDLVVAIIGVINARCVFVPVDSSLPQRRLSLLMRESQLDGMVISGDLFSGMEGYSFSVFKLSDILSRVSESALTDFPDYQENDGLYLYFTSGSTGIPKAVLGRNSSLWHFISWEIEAFGIRTPHRFSQFISPYFDAFLRDIFVPLLSGGTICVPPRDEDFFTTDKLRRWIDEQKIGFIHCVPSVFRIFNDTSLETQHFQELKYVLLSGERIVPAELQSWYQTFGNRIQLVNLYGATEATMISSYYHIKPEDARKAKIPIGEAIADTALIVSDSNLNRCQPLISGDLYIVSNYLSKGYFNNEVLTAEKFIKRDDGRIAYKTGDKARQLADGSIDLLGREDRLIKLRGIRIELNEIESVLVQSDLIKGAVVLHDKETDSLVGFITVRGDSGESLLLELEEHLNHHLPAYMVPSKLITVDSFPLLSNGKTDYSKLKEKATAREIVLPLNETEEKILSIWNEILHVGQISTDDKFHSVGGNSLSIMKLMARIFSEFEVRMTLAELFKNLTIQKQAMLVKEKLEKLQTSIENDNCKSTISLSRIQKAPDQLHYNLSSAQKRLYFQNQFDKTSIAYNMPQAFSLTGKLEENRLQDIFRELIKRHESLRTSFRVLDSGPVQTVSAQVDFYVDFVKTGKESLDNAIRSFVKPFDLSQAPLLRVAVLSTSPSDHILLSDMHHIISDGVSQSLLVRDFKLLYQNEALPELGLQYTDYCEWQQSFEYKEALGGHRDFWMEEFSNEVPILELPTDFPRPSLKTSVGDSVSFDLDQKTTRQLTTLAKELDCSLFMVILSLYNILLVKLTGKDDIVVGSPVSGRVNEEATGNMIGVFINMLALRNKPSEGLIFKAFLEQLKANTLACLDHQFYPYEDLVEELKIERDTSRNSLFDTMFVFHNFEKHSFTLSDLTVSGYELDQNVSKFDLSLSAREDHDQLWFRFEYSSDLFLRATIEHFITYFKSIIFQVIADPAVKIRDIDIVPARQLDQILKEFNNTIFPYPQGKTIVDCFEEQVLRNPDRLAIEFKSESLTYEELNTRANQLACWLSGKETVKGRIVGLLLDRSLEMLVGIFGILKAGGAYLPIDPELPKERVDYMLKESDAILLLTQQRFIEKYEQDILVADINTTEIYDLQGDNPSISIGRSDLAYCIFTSGSGGLPKGVLMEHRSVVSLIWSFKEKIYSHFTKVPLHVGMVAPYSFDCSVKQVFGALLQGHSLYVLEDSERKDGQLLKEFCERKEIDLTDATPTHLSMLLGALGSNEQLVYPTSWTFGGEELSKHLVEAFLAKTGKNSIKLFNVYGPTETCVNSTYYEIQPERMSQYPFIPIGRPLPNERIYIVDGSGKPVPFGIDGEICIAGDGLARGYLDKEKTDEKFKDNWVPGGERVYLTGDLGIWLPDGNIVYRGRKDNQVKLRGYRIELGEIETQLMAHKSINQAIVSVTGKPQDKCLVAYYLAKEEVYASELRAHLSGTLPKYMIPTYFVRLDKIPLTSNGKVNYKSLPAPEIEVLENFVKPYNQIQKELIKIWCRILSLEEDKISIDSSFFDLGGNSLKLTALTKNINDHFNSAISIAEIFNSPTVSLLAKLLNDLDKIGPVKVDPQIEEDLYLMDETLNIIEQDEEKS